MHAPKWRTGAGVLTLLAWLASCGPNNKTVEYPLIETANTNALDIAKVELTDSATILHTDAYYRPHNWIRISSESYLQAGGKRYMLTGAEGITPDSLFWMPESGEASFTLRFEPLPSGTPSFDFIESDCEDCFKLFGIDLTGKKTFDTPDEVPEDLRQADGDTAVPDPIFKTGTTTVNVHFLHYRPELGKEANLYVNTLFGTQQPYTATIDYGCFRRSPQQQCGRKRMVGSGRNDRTVCGHACIGVLPFAPPRGKEKNDISGYFPTTLFLGHVCQPE